jgi:hypothetical protein
MIFGDIHSFGRTVKRTRSMSQSSGLPTTGKMPGRSDTKSPSAKCASPARAAEWAKSFLAHCFTATFQVHRNFWHGGQSAFGLQRPRRRQSGID